jgi:hypothetical protein
VGLRPDAPRVHSNKVGWCDLTVNRKPRANGGGGDTTEVTDIISPGNEDAFTVGERTRISAVSELPPPFHRQLIEGPFAATAATYDSKGKARYGGTRTGSTSAGTPSAGVQSGENLPEHREVSRQAIGPADPTIGSRSTVRW